MADVDENVALDQLPHSKLAGRVAAVLTSRAAFGNIANQLPEARRATAAGAGGVKQGVMTRHQVAAANKQTAAAKAPLRAPLRAIPQPSSNAQLSEVPVRAIRPRKSLTAQLVESSTATQSRKRSTKASTRVVPKGEPGAQFVAPPSPLPDIDSQDKADPLHVTSLVCEIFNYYRRTEAAFRPTPSYMNRQQDINDRMRGILVDWLVEVHMKFKLMPETLFLTANLIDRFLEIRGVTRKNLQLVGVTAMLIASKYEEIWAPEVHDFVYISDSAYRREEILKMEKVMLNSLKFNLTVPTPYNFLSRFLKAAGAGKDKEVSHLASYLTELALPDYPMLKFSYSEIAAAAVFVANRTLSREPAFPRSLQKHCGFTLEALMPAATSLVALQAKAPNSSLPAVFKKYSQGSFHHVARLSAMCPDLL